MNEQIIKQLEELIVKMNQDFDSKTNFKENVEQLTKLNESFTIFLENHNKTNNDGNKEITQLLENFGNSFSKSIGNKIITNNSTLNSEIALLKTRNVILLGLSGMNLFLLILILILK